MLPGEPEERGGEGVPHVSGLQSRSSRRRCYRPNASLATVVVIYFTTGRALASRWVNASVQ